MVTVTSQTAEILDRAILDTLKILLKDFVCRWYREDKKPQQNK